MSSGRDLGRAEPPPADPLAAVSRLLAIMAHLRDPEVGCPWDRAQTFATIAPYTVEEAYEVADAIARSDLHDLKDELGDLLLQVVFHARIAEEAGHFAFADVATAVADKLEARHPHLFASPGAGDHHRGERWEAIKAEERRRKGATSAMDGVALALPALLRAEKLQRRAAREGFDWPDARGPAAKLREEIVELDAAEHPDERLAEAGDLLFAAVNLLRHHGISAEEALRAGNAKFTRRYRAMEQLAALDGVDFTALSLERQEQLWQRVKRSETDAAS